MNRPATLLVLLLAGLLAGCGGGSRPTGIRAAETPADDVAEYQPRWRSHTVDSTQYRKVFLAGTIDMGRSSDWQAALVARFRDSIGGRWLFFNPRRREFHASPAEMEYQVAWELAHLEAADLIVMNLLGDSRSPISLLEMGLYARSGKLFVACSPDYYRYDNVRITCRRYGVPLYDSLTALLDDLPQQFLDTATQLCIDWGYWGLFLSAFVAGSIVPFSSEAVMVVLVRLGLDPALCLLAAATGNTAGGMTCYWIGHLGKREWFGRYLGIGEKQLDRAGRFLAGKGAWSAFFAFLPYVGEAIAILLGLMRSNVWITTLAMFAGKALRYVAVLYAVQGAISLL